MRVGDHISPEDPRTYPMVVGQQIGKFHLGNHTGRWRILLFYPLDFTFVCPTELLAFGERLEDFHARNCDVYGISVDSEFSHLTWLRTARHKGGLDGLQLPLVSDLTKELAQEFGVLHADGMAYRGMFVLDPSGQVRIAHVHDFPIGRNVDEALRILDALRFHEEHGEVCPANWKAGEKGMKADPEGSLEYFQEKNLKVVSTNSDEEE